MKRWTVGLGILLAALPALAAPAYAGALGGAHPTAGDGGAGGVEDGGRRLVVHVAGDVNVEKRAQVPTPPPLCWWEPVKFVTDPHNAAAVRAWFVLYSIAYPPPMNILTLFFPPMEVFDKAIVDDAVGDGVTWYSMHSVEDMTDAESQSVFGENGCAGLRSVADGLPYLTLHKPMPYQQEPPPRVDPETLAEYAADVLDLVEPSLEWNPRIDSLDGAALLNLPTWVWVEDPDALRVRSATASALGVSATVTARPTGKLSVSSPAGGTTCTRAQGRQAYAPGVDPADACTFEFDRASYGHPDGFPVRTSAGWEVTWTSSTGASGVLPDRNLNAVTNIHVAGSQALVSEVD